MTVVAGSHTPGFRAKPTVIHKITLLELPASWPRTKRRKSLSPDQQHILAALSSRPEGRDLCDEQGRRLLAGSRGRIYDDLRAAGLIELVQIPCICGRPSPVCACELMVYRLAGAPERSNVIHAADRFRRAS